MTIYDKLKGYGDPEFREFQSKLVPNIPVERMIGIRTPDMRAIAKELYGTKEGKEFLKSLPHKYYEENIIHFFMIALSKDFDECIAETDRFLPYVDCWPVSDQASPKVFKKNHEKLRPHVKRWIDSEHVYTARFGIRMLMNEYLGEDFKEEYLSWVAAKEGEDYYLKMMVAWYFATALAKQYDASVKYIEQGKLETWTHNKAIQKALESFRVTEEHKAWLRSLKRS